MKKNENVTFVADKVSKYLEQECPTLLDNLTTNKKTTILGQKFTPAQINAIITLMQKFGTGVTMAIQHSMNKEFESLLTGDVTDELLDTMVDEMADDDSDMDELDLPAFIMPEAPTHSLFHRVIGRYDNDSEEFNPNQN